MKNFFRKITLTAFCILLGVGIFRIQKYFDSYKEIKFVNLNPVFLPDGEVLKWLSMGFRGITADYLWIRSVLYYGRRVTDWDNPYYRYAVKEKQDIHPDLAAAGSNVPDSLSYQVSANDTLKRMTEQIKNAVIRRKKRGKHIKYIYPLLDRVTTIDPHFEFPYIFGGVYLLMDTHEVTRAFNLLEKGFKANRDSWKFPFYLGWIEWMYKNNPSKAVEYIIQAVNKENCPEFVENMLSWLMRYIKYEKIDHRTITKSYLLSLKRTTKNEKLKARIDDYLQQLKTN